jgi:hypothetical protein
MHVLDSAAQTANMQVKYTHVRINLQQTHVAMLFQQLANGLLITCYKVVELNRPVTSCSNNLLSSCGSTICQQFLPCNLVAT